jgi:hypothetical protein
MAHPGHDKDMERALDEALMATFPASDPVALTAIREPMVNRPTRRRWPPQRRTATKRKT